MKKYFIPILALAFGALSSCNYNDNETITAQKFADCYAIITDTQSGVSTVSTAVNVGLNLNWTDGTANAAFVGLEVNGEKYPQMTLLKMKWGIAANGWCSISTTEPETMLSTGVAPAVSDFHFEWNDRMDIPDLDVYNGEYDPVFVYSFELDDVKKYSVKGSRVPFNFWGKATTTSTDVEPFTSEVNKIVATPDFKNMTMTVLVNGAQFDPRMPALNIQIDNIPMVFVNGGESFTFKADNIIPTIGGDPYPDYPCNNINGTLDPKTGMSFSFDCTVKRAGKVYTVTTNPTVFGYR